MSRNNKSHRKHRYKRIIKKFPCEDCITLPICMNIPPDEGRIYGGLIGHLTDKCSLLEEYIIGNSVPRQRASFKSRQMGLRSEMQTIRDREMHTIKFFASKGVKYLS